MTALKFERYIRDSKGEKTECARKSVNLTKAQDDFLKRHDLNLSLIVRDVLDSMIREYEKTSRK